MQINQKVKSIRTHEGAKAKRISEEQMLTRSVLACMLWENEFYEGGQPIADRIYELCGKVSGEFVSGLAIEARLSFKLRHAPLWLVIGLIGHGAKGKLVSDTIEKVINRPDEIAELLSMYWANGKKPLSKGLKSGLARAFNKFDEYQFAKWNRDREIKLRDVLFMVHPKPKNSDQQVIFDKIAENNLATPNTWESRMASGENKKSVFTDLLETNKLGYMALLRNLRGMVECGVDLGLIKKAILNVSLRYAPVFAAELDCAMGLLLNKHQKLPGKTIILVDVSGSMIAPLSGKSDLLRIDAACGLAILLAGICEDIRIFSFSERVVEVPALPNIALCQMIKGSQRNNGTYLGDAVRTVSVIDHDRLIVITDEQSRDSVPDPIKASYMINVASNKNGVGYGKWCSITGFSEAVVDYIVEAEKLEDIE